MFQQKIRSLLVACGVIVFLLFGSALSAQADGQVELTTFPKNLQLYPRSVESNLATLIIEGVATGSSVAQVEVWRSQELIDTLTDADGGEFAFYPTISAELQNYTIVAYHVDNAIRTEIARAENVVAGDVFVINGQSNATAKSYEGLANPTERNPFVRSYGTGAQNATDVPLDIGWHIADGDSSNTSGAIGQWAIRMSNLLVQNNSVPLAVINGGLEGKAIEFFARHEQNPVDLETNYGRLLYRLNAAGVRNNIRAMFWYQGENDFGDTEKHIAGFDALYANWKQDYPSIEQHYVFQIADNCLEALGITLRNAQRLLGHRYDDINVVSTNGLTGHRTDCHYNWENGYKDLGERTYRMVARDFYGGSAEDVAAPEVESVYFSDSTNSEITMQLREPQADMVIGSGAVYRFFMDSTPIAYFDGIPRWVAPDKIVLGLSRAVTSTAVLDYYGDTFFEPENPEDDITNSTGHGMLAFQITVDAAEQAREVVSVDVVINNDAVTESGTEEISDAVVSAPESESVTMPEVSAEPESFVIYDESSNQYLFDVKLPDNFDEISMSRLSLLDEDKNIVGMFDLNGFAPPFAINAAMLESEQTYTIELLVIDTNGKLIETEIGERLVISNTFLHELAEELQITEPTPTIPAPTAPAPTVAVPTATPTAAPLMPSFGSSVEAEPEATVVVATVEAEPVVENEATAEPTVEPTPEAVVEPIATATEVVAVDVEPLIQPKIWVKSIALNETGEQLVVSAELTDTESVARYAIEVANMRTNAIVSAVDRNFSVENPTLVPISGLSTDEYELTVIAFADDDSVITRTRGYFDYTAPAAPDSAEGASPPLLQLLLVPLAGIVLLAIVAGLGILIYTLIKRRDDDDDYENERYMPQGNQYPVPAAVGAAGFDNIHEERRPQRQNVRPIMLKVLGTPDTALKGMAVQVTDFPFMLGRENCDLAVQNDPHISREHAVITAENGQYFVTDLDSGNGVYIDGRRIGSNIPTQIVPRTQIRLGTSTVFSVGKSGA